MCVCLEKIFVLKHLTTFRFLYFVYSGLVPLLAVKKRVIIQSNQVHVCVCVCLCKGFVECGFTRTCAGGPGECKCMTVYAWVSDGWNSHPLDGTPILRRQVLWFVTFTNTSPSVLAPFAPVFENLTRYVHQLATPQKRSSRLHTTHVNIRKTLFNTLGIYRYTGRPWEDIFLECSMKCVCV